MKITLNLPALNLQSYYGGTTVTTPSVPPSPPVFEEFDGDTLCKEFNPLADQLCVLCAEDEPTLRRIAKFRAHFEDVASFAHLYDVAGVRVNGYWSYLRVWLRFFEAVLEAYPLKPNVLIDFAILLRKTETWPRVMASMRLPGDRESRRDAWEELCNSMDDQMLELTVKEHLIGLPFSDKTKTILRNTVHLLGFLYAKGYRRKAKCALNFDHAAQSYVDFLINGPVELIHTFLCITQQPLSIVGSFFRKMKGFKKTRKVSGRWLIVDTRQCWTYERDQTSCKLLKNEFRPSVQVRCRVVSRPTRPNRTNGAEDKVLIYLHGGAFLGPSADSYENTYVGQWADRLRGLHILCFDFPRGPEVKFPEALQATLDFYLWLSSGTKEVEDMLGFIPRDIVLSGESSGGNLASALMVSLNDIRKFEDVRMPSTLICFYPKIGLEYELFPSAFIQAFDPFINKHCQLKVTDAYIPKLAYDAERDSWDEVDSRCRDWTVRNSGGLIMRSPYLSPYTYDSFDELADVRLSLMVLHFCPFMDEGLELGRRWRGPVEVKAVDGAFHPCLSASGMTPEAAAGAEVAFNMIKTATVDP